MRALAFLGIIGAVGIGAVGIGAAGPASAADRNVTEVVVCDQFGASLSIRPTSFSLSCEDRDGLLTRMTWESWRKGGANGHGTFSYNACQPSCASGQRRATHATVSLTRPRKQKSSRVFTRVTVRFTDAVGNRVTKRYRAIPWQGEAPDAQRP